MKITSITTAAAALAALCLALQPHGAQAGNVRHHHHHHHHHHHKHHHHKQQHHQQQPNEKHLYRVKGSKAAFDTVLKGDAGIRDSVDVWRIKRASAEDQEDPSQPFLQADVFATADAMDAFKKAAGTSTVVVRGKHMRGHVHHQSHLKVEQTDFSEQYMINKDRAEVAACLNETDGYMAELAYSDVSYTDSAFFHCFRPADQIFAFFDLLAQANPEFVTKIDHASSTFEGAAIPAFKISTSNKKKRALYTQALIHAREWQAGASTHYTMASLLDDLRNGDASTGALFDEFDWYFVPIVNVDGYKYTWTHDRLWRTNRHVENHGEYTSGVDLNRNFGPEEYFNLDPELSDSETEPGPKPLSEPSTKGLFQFITSIEGMSGIVDMHGFGGQVLRPFSDVKTEPDEPFGSKMRTFASGIKTALSTKQYTDVEYVSETGAWLYEAYGCFDDGMFRAYNFTVPAITIEVEGDDFIAPQESIVAVGKNVHHGLLQFAKESSAYQEFVEEYFSDN